MQNEKDIIQFLRDQTEIYYLLSTVSKLEIDDCWIGAGLIRNAIWDHLHHFPITPHATSDIDVIYFDPQNCHPQYDQQIEAQLFKIAPNYPWSVRNQARMHKVNSDPAYTDISDALLHWPETATAIAARLHHNQIEILCPHGVTDLLDMKIRPSPAFSHKLPLYEKRLAAKEWHLRWPNVTR